MRQREDLIQKFKEMPWEIWLHRRFAPFITYMMQKYGTRAGFKTQGLDGQFPISLYDTDDWYSTPEMFALAGKEAAQYLRQKDIFTITEQCEKLLERGRKEIIKLCESADTPRDLFKKVLEVIGPVNVYILVAHGAEQHYHPIIREMVKQYVPAEEVETFIGDISLPSKKNALALMESDVRLGLPTEELHKKYAWIKARGGFLPGYTLEEMQEIKEKILNEPEKHLPKREIPEALQSLAKEVQELVYLRTLRTDALYELYYLAQPIFDRYAKELEIDSVQDYIPDELLAGRIEKIPHEYAIMKYDDDILVVKESIISQKKVISDEIKGVVAYKGFVTGTVRIVHTASDSEKVQTGDILVTNMTTPAYIAAMYRAAAFVTNEGGITCHAAILAREMKKPCIIGTKNATKILKDGDMVEVDADKGTVKIIR